MSMGLENDNSREASVSSMLVSFKNYVAESIKAQILCIFIEEVLEALEASFKDTSCRSFIFPLSNMPKIIKSHK